MSDTSDAAIPAPRPTTSGWLTGLRHAMRHARERASLRLAIDQLPDTWSVLARGGMHAVYAAPGTPACDALIWNTARAAGIANVTVVRGLPHAQVAAQLRALGFVNAQPARGWPRHLNVLSLPPAAVDPEPGGTCPLLRLGTLLRSLLRSGLRRDSLCIIDDAQRWFSWDDPLALHREVELLARWCSRRHVAMVLILASRLTRKEQATARSHEALHAFHQRFSGVARLERSAGELRWHADVWRAGEALVANEDCPLRFDTAGHLVALRNPADSAGCATAQATLLLQDERRLIASSALISGEGWVPPDWEIQPDNDAVYAASASAQAATIVFTFGANARLDDLCAMIHTLRRSGGGSLKIVTAACSETMGLQHELLLLAVGADLVLERDLPFTRVLSALQSLQGQFHTRPTVEDWRGALAAAQPDAGAGYLPVPRFCEHIEAALQRSRPLLLPHVLAELSLRPDVAHLDALRACRLRQPGQFVTVFSTQVYVFLFACRPPDADAALADIFCARIHELFDTVTLHSGHAISCHVEMLRDRQLHACAPDYSDLLPSWELPPASTLSIVDAGVAAAIGPAAVPAQAARPAPPNAHGPTHRAEPCTMPLNHRESA